jgi:hypothetical protein
MKYLLNILLLLSAISFFSCEKDEGLPPNMSFKTGGVYVSSDIALAHGSVLVVGIDASKSEEADVLKKFTISKSVNGGTATTVYTQDLSGSEGDTYTHDYVEVVGPNVGEVDKYTFTITNRDGLTKQLTLTVTIL